MLIISDNGKGFDPTTKRKGIGFNNIINRADVFNGKVDIDSSPGNGCIVKVIFENVPQPPDISNSSLVI
jgi:signal transduction histidine kinase